MYAVYRVMKKHPTWQARLSFNDSYNYKKGLAQHQKVLSIYKVLSWFANVWVGLEDELHTGRLATIFTDKITEILKKMAKENCLLIFLRIET